MSDSDSDERKKRPRSSYKQYNEPQREGEYVLPRTTLITKKKRKLQQPTAQPAPSAHDSTAAVNDEGYQCDAGGPGPESRQQEPLSASSSLSSMQSLQSNTQEDALRQSDSDQSSPCEAQVDVDLLSDESEDDVPITGGPDITGDLCNCHCPDTCKCQIFWMDSSSRSEMGMHTESHKCFCPLLCVCHTGTTEEDTENQPDSDECFCSEGCECKTVIRSGHPQEPEQAAPLDNSGEQDKYQWDMPVREALGTTRFEVFLMLFHLFIRHGLTYALVEDILKMVNRILGSEVLKTTEYIFRQLFTPKVNIFTHIFCPKCELYIGEKTKLSGPVVICPCGHSINITILKENFFVTMSISDLLKVYFKKPDLNLLEPRDRHVGRYEDVMDGDLYEQEIRAEIKKGKNVLSLCFNTDGARVFRSRSGSMWPIQFIINEVDLKERFKDDNVLLCGLYFGKGTPNMTCFLKPFTDELESLAMNGVELVTSFGVKKLYHVYVYAPLCSVDSGAKPKILRQKAHNGKFACGYGLHPNLPVPGFPANQLRFVVKDTNNQPCDCELRSHDTMVADMLKADELDRQGKLKKGKETDDNVNGLFGVSVLAGVPKFNLVHGFVIDYLHTLALGILAGLIKLWFDTPSVDPTHNPRADLDRINQRLSSIKPPQAMATPSKSLSTRDTWKGKQLRLFGLFYALPCLKGLPKFSERHFRHLQKFVSAFQVLLSSVITEDQLNHVEVLLREFVCEYQELYGAIHMTLNVHLLLHVCDVVRNWGPMPPYSNFCFESGNGRLRTLVRGTRGVVTQITGKWAAMFTMSDFIGDHVVSERVLKFCSALLNYSPIKKSFKASDVRALGAEKVSVVSAKERDALIESGFDVEEDSLLTYYNRVIYRGIPYYSAAYEQPKNYNDTCVKLCDGGYAITAKFVKLPDHPEILVVIQPLCLSRTDERLAPLIETGAYYFLAPQLRVVPVTDIVAKCLLIEFENQHYICNLPNTYERD